MQLAQYSLPTLQKVEALGVLSCLGGESNSLRVGGRVTLSHTDLRATLVSQSDVGGLTHVVMDSSPPCACPAGGVTSSSSSSPHLDDAHADTISRPPLPLHANGLKALKPIRMNYEELTPLPDTSPSEGDGGWWCAEEYPHHQPKTPLSSVVRAQMALVLSLLSQQQQQRTGSSACWKDARRPPPSPPPPSLGGVFLAQCKSRALKVLDGVVLKARITMQEIVEHVPELLEALLGCAILCDTSEHFVTLDVAELKAHALRKRLYHLNHHCWGESRHVGDDGGGGGDGEGPSQSGGGEDSAVPLSPSPPLPSVEGPQQEANRPDDDDDEKDNKGAVAVMVAAASPSPPSPELVEELMAMGFPMEWCYLALTENPDDLVSASTWIVDHLDMLSSMDVGGGGGGEGGGGGGGDGTTADPSHSSSGQYVDSGRDHFEESDVDDEKDGEDEEDVDDEHEHEQHEEEDGGGGGCGDPFGDTPPLYGEGPDFGNDAAGMGMDNGNDDGSGSDDDDDANGSNAMEELQDGEEECDESQGQGCEREGGVGGMKDMGESSSHEDEGSDDGEEGGFPNRALTWFSGGGDEGSHESSSFETFGETYFPHDVLIPAATHPGDGEGTGAVPNPGHFDVYNYSASLDGMSVRDCVSERAKIKTMLSAVTRLDMSQLLVDSMQVEVCISILRCRMLLVHLFHTWANDLTLTLAHFGGNPHAVLRLCKAICFRGAQFPIPRVQGGGLCEEKRGKFTWETSRGAARLNACDIMEDLVIRLLRVEKKDAAAASTTTHHHHPPPPPPLP
jgi:hypothetical protein